MPGIKAVNSKDIKVINCTFSGFDTDIELENVESFLSQGNQFSQLQPQVLLDKLCSEIAQSNLDDGTKKRLFKQIIKALKNKEGSHRVKSKIMNFLGKKAVDYFIQLAAAVSAGLIIK